MKFSLSRLALAATALVAIAGPAVSGDWNNGAGGIKDYRGGGVPVPAPAPIPESKADWYMRGDVGYSVGSSGKITTTGADYGAYTDFSEADGTLFGSIGIGAYLGHSFRAEVAVDIRPDQRIGRKAPKSRTVTTSEQGDTVNQYVTYNGSNLTVQHQSYDFHNYQTTRTEDIRTANNTVMFNVYRDIETGGAFTPYIGAGLGLAVSTVKTRFNERGSCTGSYRQYTDFYGDIVQEAHPTCTAQTKELTSSDGRVETTYGLAAAIMAGGSYRVSEITSIDVGYRFLWQGTSADVSPHVGPDGASRIQWDSRIDHEIRTGVRFDIN